MPGGARFQKSQPGEKPFGERRLAQRIVDMPALPALPHKMMRAQNGQVLRHRRMADAEDLLEAVDIQLAVMQLHKDPQPVRVGDGAKQLCQFFRDQRAFWNSRLPSGRKTVAAFSIAETRKTCQTSRCSEIMVL